MASQIILQVKDATGEIRLEKDGLKFVLSYRDDDAFNPAWEKDSEYEVSKQGYLDALVRIQAMLANGWDNLVDEIFPL